MAKATGEPGNRGGRGGAPTLRANVAQLRALAHPLRLRIAELFAEGPRTTMQVAELIGQPPTRLYHHVQVLERAGILRLRETRENRGAVEKWYEAAPLQSAGGRGRRNIGAIRNLALLALEQSRSELISAIGRSRPKPLVGRLVAVGTPARMRRIRKRLLALVRELRRDTSGTTGPDVQRWALTLAFAPTGPASANAGRKPRVRDEG